MSRQCSRHPSSGSSASSPSPSPVPSSALRSRAFSTLTPACIAASMSDATAPQAPAGSYGCFLIQQVMVESPGRQSAGPIAAAPAEHPDENDPHTRAIPKETQEVKCFILSSVERRAFRTLRRATVRGSGRSFALSDRLARSMRNFLPPRSALLLVLVASVAMAKEREAVFRNLYLSDSPRDEVRPVYVAGEMGRGRDGPSPH